MFGIGRKTILSIVALAPTFSLIQGSQLDTHLLNVCGIDNRRPSFHSASDKTLRLHILGQIHRASRWEAHRLEIFCVPSISPWNFAALLVS